jgi:hypothetical protein
MPDLSNVVLTSDREFPAIEYRKHLQDDIKSRFEGTPKEFRSRLVDVANEPTMRDAFQMLETRMDWDKALLVGAFLNDNARQYMDESMDNYWRASGNPGQSNNGPRDVIIGGGLHAAVYAAVAHRKTGVRPIVIDNGERVGGTFAVTSKPTFFLNSRNRPGPLGLPGTNDRPGSLNVIPGAPIQPADLSAAEYADNASLGWAIRLSLLMHAYVIKGTAVDITDNIVELGGGERIDARRVIVATGLGRQRRFGTQSSERVLSYYDFLRKMEDPFPLQGMQRVAVIGAGDSGKTTVEALTGQGPTSSSMSVMSLDFPAKIDWYGCGSFTCSDWESRNRNRYKGIGRNLPRDLGSGNTTGDTILMESRVQPVVNGNRAEDISVGYDEVMVNGRPYDYAVICTGFEEAARPLDRMDAVPLTNSAIYQVGGMQVGRQYGNGGLPYYLVGPAAQLTPTTQEQNAAPRVFSQEENNVAIFRYARKTAALAEAIN